MRTTTTSSKAVAAAVFTLLWATTAAAGVASTSTTTTTFGGTTTTTMFEPTDVTGGGRFEGSFPAGSFDSYSFELAEPRVLVAETSNGFGGCPGDTFVELRQPGAPGNCDGLYGDGLPCIAFDDDSGISLCAKLVKHIVPPGTYEIRVRTVGFKQLLRYFIEVDFIEIECGNGVVEITEGCDDGNLEAGDCCSPTCQKDDPGTPCDDGLFCNGDDSCGGGGLCSLHTGNPCPGSDGDGNCSETCNEAADNCQGADSNGSPCDDGLFCNGADTCLGGACSVHAGDPCPGADGDIQCSESCDEAADNCQGADPDDSPCEDGLICTGADTCQAGECSGHTQNPPCPGPDGDADCSESCDDASEGCGGPDPDGSPCNDGNFCNGKDFCSGGSCSVHAGSPCPGADGDANCSESCNEALDTCDAADPVEAPCSDGDPCTSGDTCDGAGTCLSGAPDGCATTTTTVGAGVCGDQSGDGQVKASDALAILKAAVGGSQCDAKPCVCDTNGSGSVTAVDALVALRLAVGGSVNLACPC